jgi:hypothetical protein
MKNINKFVALFTIALIFMQFRVSMQYEPVAEVVGIMDQQTKELNTAYLDYEEQGAILRSSKFLVTEKASGYVSSPAKVLYVDLGDTIVSSND